MKKVARKKPEKKSKSTKPTRKTLLEEIEIALTPFDIYGLTDNDVQCHATHKQVYDRLFEYAVKVAENDPDFELFDHFDYEHNPRMGIYMLRKRCKSKQQRNNDNEKSVAKAAFWHNENYTTVKKDGIIYSFNQNQGRIVKYLHENGSAHIAVLAELVESTAEKFRLKDYFDRGKHPAWEAIIVSDDVRKGFYVLKV